MPILVIPTHHERRAALKALPNVIPIQDQPVLTWQAGGLCILESGMGFERVETMLPHLEALAPEAVWLFGWCGGLDTDLNVSDLVLADSTVLGDGQRIAHPPGDDLTAYVKQVARDLGQRFSVGPVLTSERVLVTVADKQAGRATGAVAVEMEAGPLARWAVDRGLPFAHLRVVLDPATSALPPEAKRPKRRARTELGVTLQRYLCRPFRAWPAVLRLHRQFLSASKTMTGTIAALTLPDGPLDTNCAGLSPMLGRRIQHERRGCDQRERGGQRMWTD